MKLLVFSLYPETPHFETELEIIQKSLDNGDQVTIAFCENGLKSCLYNPSHNLLVCEVCKSKRKNGFSMLSGSYELVSFKMKDIDEFKELKIKSLKELKEVSFEGIQVGRGVASTLISRYREYDIDVDSIKDEIVKELNMAVGILFEARNLISSLNPDKVLLFNGRFSSYFPILQFCEKNDYKYLIHERGGNFGTYMFRENAMPHSRSVTEAEIELLWNQDPEYGLLSGEQFFVERRNKVVQSWVVFTENQENGRLPENIDLSKKIVCIFNSSLDEFESISGWEMTLYSSQNQAIRNIADSLKNNDDIQLFLRVHPNLAGLHNTQTKEIQQLILDYPNLHVIPADAKVDTYALIDVCDKVLIFNSTVGIEATFWNKPSIIIGRAMYENLNCCYLPKTHEEVMHLIFNEVPPKPKINAIKFGYWQREFGVKFQYTKQVGIQKAFFKGKKVVPNVLLRFFAHLYFKFN